MSKYHINPETGNASKCTAQKKCPFGDLTDDHYASLAQARDAYEAQMEEVVRHVTTAGILSTVELKEMDAALLATTLFTEAGARNLDASYIASAIDVAAILHAKQTRAVRAGFNRTPYIEHPLRNAVRLMRMGVTNNNLIVAAVLHDTVEDGSEIFVEKYLKITPTGEEANRAKLRSFIKQQYGEETLSVVNAVTNPVADPARGPIPKKLKHEEYRAHVVESISSSPGAYLVKFSDLIDNAGSLSHQDLPGNEKMVMGLASKYQPLIKDFQAHAPSVKNLVDKAGYQKIIADLERLDGKLLHILKKYS